MFFGCRNILKRCKRALSEEAKHFFQILLSLEALPQQNFKQTLLKKGRPSRRQKFLDKCLTKREKSQRLP